MPKVSVIVASHREDFIEGLFTALKAAAAQSVPAEIIIVTDYTVDEYTARFPDVVWLYVPDKSIPVKRNRGILAARGAVCAFIDDDCIPDVEWLAKGVEYLDIHPDMAGVEGMTIIEEEHRKVGAYREYKRLESQGYRTNNIFYRQKSLAKINLFDERFSFQREDVDLAYSLIEAGFSIGYSRNITVTHRFRKNEKWDLLKNCFNRRFDPLLHRKHTMLYRHYIGTPWPPGIAFILLTHMVFIFGIMLARSSITVVIPVEIALVCVLTVRRAGLPFVGCPVQWLREFFSFILSPFVLVGALLYGSIRFRHLLLI
jgi:glycosyltransferase involved in cell wall biosynthesis